MSNDFNSYPIPDNWLWTSIGTLCLISSGGTPDRKIKTYYSGTIPWIKSGELNHNVITKSEEFISEEAMNNSNVRIFPAGSVLVALYGSTVGKLAILGFSATTNQAVAAIRTTPGLNNKYLYYFLLKNRENLLKQRQGAAQPNISQKILNEFRIPLAPVNEQNKIVQKIDEYFSELEKTSELLNLSLIQLKNYRQSVLNHAFQGLLTKDWRHKHPLKSADQLIEFINDYFRRLFQLQLNEYDAGRRSVKPKAARLVISQEVSTSRNRADIPEGWIRILLENIAEKITDGTHHTPNYTNKGIHFISVKDIYNDRVNFEHTKYIDFATHLELIKRCHPEQGDLLMTKSGTIGRIAIVPEAPEFSLFVSVALIKPFKELIYNKFLKYALLDYINSIDIKQDIKGAVIKNFHLEDIRIANIPLCSYDEQVAIVEEIEHKFSLITQLERTIDDCLLQAETLKFSILQKAFEGKLCEQDPEPEDAGLLLEKILDEKAALFNEETRIRKSEKKLYINTRKMATELKSIMQILSESNQPVPSKVLWQSSEHRDDIDAFYAALKKLIDSAYIVELPREGKESYLKLATSDENR